MIVGMWMTRDVVSVLPGATIAAAADLMRGRHVRRLPVVERRSNGEHLVGIVTSRDQFRAYPVHVNPFSPLAASAELENVVVADVMKRDPLTTAPDAPIEHPARAMCDHKIGGVPVVDKGLLAGIITKSDIFRAFVAMLDSLGGSVRVTLSMARSEDVFGLVHRLSMPRQVRVVSLISTEHHGTPVCVVRLAGGDLDRFLDDLWKSGHHVINVLRNP
jgi:acetoin utilization protein AcuB